MNQTTEHQLHTTTHRAKHGCRGNKGFTLAELLMAAAILTVLAAVTLLAVIPRVRSMRQTKLDKMAETIYTAAQSRLSETYAFGDPSRLLEGSGTIVGLTDGAGDSGPKYRYLTSSDTGTNAYRELFPDGADDVLGASESAWVIEYEAVSCQVVNAFYRDAEGLGGFGQTALLHLPRLSIRAYASEAGGALATDVYAHRADLIESRDVRSEYHIGWYGGGVSAIAGYTASVGSASCAVRLVNAETLYAEMNVTVPAELADGYTGTPYTGTPLLLTITVEEYNDLTLPNAIQAFSGPVSELSTLPETDGLQYEVDDDTGEGRLTFYYTVDSLAGALSFRNRFGGIPAGSNIAVSLKVESETGVMPTIADADVDNSLFAAADPADAALYVEYGRHLQNLADLGTTGETDVIQIADIDFARAWEEGAGAAPETSGEREKWNRCWATVYPDGTSWRSFIPVANERIRSYDGQQHSISGLIVDTASADASESDAGLFSAFDGTLVRGVYLSAPEIAASGTGNAGGFAARLTASGETTVEDCVLAGGSVTSADGDAGGFIGSITGDAALTAREVRLLGAQLSASGNGSAGGFIGSVTGGAALTVQDTQVIAAELTASGTGAAGGLIGTQTAGTLTVQTGRAAGNVISGAGGASGGLIGSMTAARAELEDVAVTGGTVTASDDAGGIAGILSASGGASFTRVAVCMRTAEPVLTDEAYVSLEALLTTLGVADAEKILKAAAGPDYPDETGETTTAAEAEWITGGGHAGGLIGASGTGRLTVSESLAASVVKAGEGQNAGGLIGSAAGDLTVRASYADCYIQAEGGRIGGLAGGCGEGSVFENCYSAGFVLGGLPSSAAGFSPVTVDTVSNAYSVFNFDDVTQFDTSGFTDADREAFASYGTLENYPVREDRDDYYESCYGLVADAQTAANAYYTYGYAAEAANDAIRGVEAKALAENADENGTLLNAPFAVSVIGDTYPYGLAPFFDVFALTNYPYPRLTASETPQTGISVAQHYGDWLTLDGVVVELCYIFFNKNLNQMTAAPPNYPDGWRVVGTTKLKKYIGTEPSAGDPAPDGTEAQDRLYTAAIGERPAVGGYRFVGWFDPAAIEATPGTDPTLSAKNYLNVDRESANRLQYLVTGQDADGFDTYDRQSLIVSRSVNETVFTARKRLYAVYRAIETYDVTVAYRYYDMPDAEDDEDGKETWTDEHDSLSDIYDGGTAYNIHQPDIYRETGEFYGEDNSDEELSDAGLARLLAAEGKLVRERTGSETEDAAVAFSTWAGYYRSGSAQAQEILSYSVRRYDVKTVELPLMKGYDVLGKDVVTDETEDEENDTEEVGRPTGLEYEKEYTVWLNGDEPDDGEILLDSRGNQKEQEEPGDEDESNYVYSVIRIETERDADGNVTGTTFREIEPRGTEYVADRDDLSESERERLGDRRATEIRWEIEVETDREYTYVVLYQDVSVEYVIKCVFHNTVQGGVGIADAFASRAAAQAQIDRQLPDGRVGSDADYQNQAYWYTLYINRTGMNNTSAVSAANNPPEFNGFERVSVEESTIGAYKTITFHYRRLSYLLTYDLNAGRYQENEGASSYSYIQPKSVFYRTDLAAELGTAFTAKLTRNGYRFTGWEYYDRKTDGTLEQISGTQDFIQKQYMPARNITVRATWDIAVKGVRIELYYQSATDPYQEQSGSSYTVLTAGSYADKKSYAYYNTVAYDGESGVNQFLRLADNTTVAALLALDGTSTSAMGTLASRAGKAVLERAKSDSSVCALYHVTNNAFNTLFYQVNPGAIGSRGGAARIDGTGYLVIGLYYDRESYTIRYHLTNTQYNRIAAYRTKAASSIYHAMTDTAEDRNYTGGGVTVRSYHMISLTGLFGAPLRVNPAKDNSDLLWLGADAVGTNRSYLVGTSTHFTILRSFDAYRSNANSVDFIYVNSGNTGYLYIYLEKSAADEHTSERSSDTDEVKFEYFNATSPDYTLTGGTGNYIIVTDGVEDNKFDGYQYWKYASSGSQISAGSLEQNLKQDLTKSQGDEGIPGNTYRYVFFKRKAYKVQYLDAELKQSVSDSYTTHLYQAAIEKLPSGDEISSPSYGDEYTFQGWYTASGGNGEKAADTNGAWTDEYLKAHGTTGTTDGKILMGSSGMTFFAYWKADDCTVSFDAMYPDASGASVSTGEEALAKTVELGRTFNGSQPKISLPEHPAQAQKKSEFDALKDRGDLSADDYFYRVGGTNDYYQFLGWYLYDSGTPTRQDLDSAVKFDINTVVTKNVTVYARWKQVNGEVTYTVYCYDKSSGLEIESERRTGNKAVLGTVIEVTAPAIDNYYPDIVKAELEADDDLALNGVKFYYTPATSWAYVVNCVLKAEVSGTGGTTETKEMIFRTTTTPTSVSELSVTAPELSGYLLSSGQETEKRVTEQNPTASFVYTIDDEQFAYQTEKAWYTKKKTDALLMLLPAGLLDWNGAYEAQLVYVITDAADLRTNLTDAADLDALQSRWKSNSGKGFYTESELNDLPAGTYTITARIDAVKPAEDGATEPERIEGVWKSESSTRTALHVATVHVYGSYALQFMGDQTTEAPYGTIYYDTKSDAFYIDAGLENKIIVTAEDATEAVSLVSRTKQSEKVQDNEDYDKIADAILALQNVSTNAGYYLTLEKETDRSGNEVAAVNLGLFDKDGYLISGKTQDITSGGALKMNTTGSGITIKSIRGGWSLIAAPNDEGGFDITTENGEETDTIPEEAGD